MKRVSLVAAAAAATLALGAAAAQGQSPSPLVDAVRSAVERGEKNIVAAAGEMPADKYGYKPTPAQRSFGAIVLHVAFSNEVLCSDLSGKARPQGAQLAATAPKSELVARLKSAFEFCETSLKGVTDAGLSDTIPLYGRFKATRAAVMVELPADLADHYGALAQYLRLNGMLPPTARGRGM